MADNRSESSFTVKVGVVIGAAVVIVVSFLGWMVNTSISHESRITKMETKLEIHIPEMKNALKDLRDITKEIREDQIRRQKKEINR